MALAIASTRSKAIAEFAGDDPQLRWSRSWSLSARILAVNLFAVLMLAGGIFYLDNFRERLLDQRLAELETNARLLAIALDEAPAGDETAARALALRFAETTLSRLRIYDPAGARVLDSWTVAGRTFVLRDPAAEPLRKHLARLLDRAVEAAVGARSFAAYNEPARDNVAAWPEATAARRTGRVSGRMRFAPDRTVIMTAAAPLRTGSVLHLTADARDITRVVRSERLRFFLIFLGVLGLSLLLSSFLARTIVRPLRRLAIAAQRVRLGRSREVTIPRFQRRRDEIGALSRTLSDMTAALRNRIDATEAFAADVAHEIKNPLASLRSAVESLGSIRDEGLRVQLLDVIRHDVDRIDRLITDIADASRLDAELSRARFGPVDLGGMVATLVSIYDARPRARDVTLAYARPQLGSAVVHGDESRLAQVARNLIDNALSFAPEGSVVEIAVARAANAVVMRVDDQGPGIPPESLDRIFSRFYSERPASEAFGTHSGLGLAIAKAIVEAHDGSIVAENRMENGRVSGARFAVRLPPA
jgi:two-component system sensor histidine kinase ChvG